MPSPSFERRPQELELGDRRPHSLPEAHRFKRGNQMHRPPGWFARGDLSAGRVHGI